MREDLKEMLDFAWELIKLMFWFIAPIVLAVFIALSVLGYCCKVYNSYVEKHELTQEEIANGF